MENRKIGILTSGGDCPGLNAVIRGAVQAAESRGWEVLGFNDGYEGLLHPVRYTALGSSTTEGIMQQGGTILGTTNRGRFVAKVGHGDKAELDPMIVQEAKETVQKLGISCLICIGGDGSLSTAQQLFEAGIPTIGVPKTIDNDIEKTTMTFGFDSAVTCVTEALDRLHTTTRSHRRVMVLEVMGRYAGWIALHGGLAGAADIILIPEIPFLYESLITTIQAKDSLGSVMIVVAEGACAQGGEIVTRGCSGVSGEHKLGGIGCRIAQHIEAETGRETRTMTLGHLQRGGTPSALDRILGIRFGVHAVDLISQEKFGQMVSFLDQEICSVPIASAVKRLKCIDPASQLVAACREIGIEFGDGMTPFVGRETACSMVEA